MNERERLVLRYLSALNQGDFDNLEDILKRAETDPALDEAIRMAHRALEAEPETTLAATQVSLTPPTNNGYEPNRLAKTAPRSAVDRHRQTQSRAHV